MTEDEILRRADEIKARRAREQIVRDIMKSEKVEIVSWEKDQTAHRVSVEKDANLAAFLYRLLDCDLSQEVQI